MDNTNYDQTEIINQIWEEFLDKTTETVQNKIQLVANIYVPVVKNKWDYKFMAAKKRKAKHSSELQCKAQANKLKRELAKILNIPKNKV